MRSFNLEGKLKEKQCLLSIFGSVSAAAKVMAVSLPTARRAIGILQERGIVHEVTGKDYGRFYAYSVYLAILNENAD